MAMLAGTVSYLGTLSLLCLLHKKAWQLTHKQATITYLMRLGSVALGSDIRRGAMAFQKPYFEARCYNKRRWMSARAQEQEIYVVCICCGVLLMAAVRK